jgi:hypothetical protein
VANPPRPLAPPHPRLSARRRPAEESDGPSVWGELLLGAEHAAASGPGIATRLALLLGLALWTLSFLRHGLAAQPLMGSFLHLVNLPFHEAGHVLLSPFGRFLTVLGGSAFQLLVPLVCGTVFLLRNREPYAAAVMAWWTGESLMDLAPYIADARALRLPLLGGRTGAEVEGHDWEYLLQTLGWLERDVALGRLAFALGAVLMLGSIAWAAAVLWRQHAGRRSPSYR